jgi:hypothetical protein
MELITRLTSQSASAWRPWRLGGFSNDLSHETVMTAASLARAAALVPVCLLALVAGCNHAPPPAAAKKPAEVVVTTPVQGDVADYQDFTGRLDGLKQEGAWFRTSSVVGPGPSRKPSRSPERADE